MSKAATTRKYGKPSKRTKAERLFAELPQSPIRRRPESSPVHVDDEVTCLTERISTIDIKSEPAPRRKSKRGAATAVVDVEEKNVQAKGQEEEVQEPAVIIVDDADGPQIDTTEQEPSQSIKDEEQQHPDCISEQSSSLRTLTWADVCPPGDDIVKIAEASFAEVYRVTNDRGTSIIKVIRLPSPIKAKTKAQVRAELVDEEPHPEEDVQGELQISEWLADIPGFVVYKERYIVQGKGTKELLETHQTFQRRMKRQDPDRAQFYPSPSRYLAETRFLVVELGDAGTALEDWELLSDSQLWDIFFLEAIALARAEDLVMFEHRDLHEGNLCVKQVRQPRAHKNSSKSAFGHSGLDITILDYGLSRAEDLSVADAKPVSFDLERDLSLFTSNHATQCKVYRQMRSFLLRADRKCLPPEAHDTPYAEGIDGPLSWDSYAPYTNVLWLAYLYEYLVDNFAGPKNELVRFKRATREMWAYLNPEAGENVPCFGSAADIVCFAVEAGWMSQEQLIGAEESILEREDSIVVSRAETEREAETSGTPVRRSSRNSKNNNSKRT